jgi:hypothetical protein
MREVKGVRDCWQPRTPLLSFRPALPANARSEPAVRSQASVHYLVYIRKNLANIRYAYYPFRSNLLQLSGAHAGSKILLANTTRYPGTHFYEHAEELGIAIPAKQWDECDAKHNVMETRYLSSAKIDGLVAEDDQATYLTK